MTKKSQLIKRLLIKKKKQLLRILVLNLLAELMQSSGCEQWRRQSWWLPSNKARRGSPYTDAHEALWGSRTACSNVCTGQCHGIRDSMSALGHKHGHNSLWILKWPTPQWRDRVKRSCVWISLFLKQFELKAKPRKPKWLAAGFLLVFGEDGLRNGFRGPRA